MKNLNALHIRSFENYESLMVPKNIPNSFLLGSFLFRQMIILSLTSCCVISFHSLPLPNNSSTHHENDSHTWPPSAKAKVVFRHFPGYRIHKFILRVFRCAIKCFVFNIFPARCKNAKRICFVHETLAIENSLNSWKLQVFPSLLFQFCSAFKFSLPPTLVLSSNWKPFKGISKQ